MARKVIIDTDPGIDDAVALAMAMFDPRLEVVAVTAAAGNVSAEQATRNVQAVIDQLDPPRLPRIGAATEPEDGQRADAYDIFGPDGLGGANFPVAELHNLHSSDKVMYDAVRAAPGEVTILCLAPLTNLALALQRDPAWGSMIGELVIMGGAVTHPGNISPVSEFNIYCDPPSARRVFASRTTKTLIPLDVTEQLLFSYDLLNRLPAETTRVGKLLRKILPHTYRTHRQLLGTEGIWLHDPMALVAVLHPELFTCQDMAGDVEIRGELTSGMTVFDRRRRKKPADNMAVAVDVDVAAVEDEIFQMLLAAGRASK